MQHVVLGVLRAQRFNGRAGRIVRVRNLDVLRGNRLQIAVYGSRVGQRASGAPLTSRGQRALRPHRLPFACGDHRQHAAVLDHLDDARHLQNLGRIGLQQLRGINRRQHHPRMQHARHGHVLHIARTARHLARNVQARQRRADRHEGGGVFQRRRRRGHAMQIDCADRLTVGHRAAVGRLDDRVLNFQHAALDAEVFGRRIDEQAAHLGGGVQQGTAAVDDGVATRREPLVRRGARIGGQKRDQRGRHVQLFGCDLQQCRAYARA